MITAFQVDVEQKCVHFMDGPIHVGSVPFSEWALINGKIAQEVKAAEEAKK